MLRPAGDASAARAITPASPGRPQPVRCRAIHGSASVRALFEETDPAVTIAAS